VLEKDYFIQVDKGIILYVPGGTFYSIYDPPYRVVSTPSAALSRLN